jgi:predicted RNase H-like nuclease (RuvC/YqgF family)
MTAQKAADPSAKSATAGQEPRKPWKKKTPVEVVLDQINRLRDGLSQKEEELKQAKRQLQKLEDVRKILESS